MWDKIIESLQQRWEACYYLFADARTVRAHQAFLNNDEKYQAEVRPRLAKKGIAEPTREQFLAEYTLIISEGAERLILPDGEIDRAEVERDIAMTIAELF